MANSTDTSPISHLLSDLDLPHIEHHHILPLLEALKDDERIRLSHEGNSFEGRSITRITYGHGPIKILAWTQMHGNEATATAAVFDLLDILLRQTSELEAPEGLFTLHVVPMLNPDGAQRCIRHNAQAIDINRDAMAKQTLEGTILMRLVDEIQPDIAFNLHDQSPYYQAGTTGMASTIAFLAPAYDIDKNIDDSRKLAITLIGAMTRAIESTLKNAIARYDDTFSPRSFGDRIAGKGAATILIESGAAANDPNRQIARRMNVKAMLAAFLHMQRQHKNQVNEQEVAALCERYWAIPENVSEALSSLVIRDLRFVGRHSYQASISIKQTARYSNQYFIDAVGDLGIQAGLEEFDASELSFDSGTVHTLNSHTILTNESFIDWLKQGVIQFQGEIQDFDNQSDHQILLNQPLNASPQALVLQQPAYFLMRKGDEVIAAVVNGQLLRLA
ncbi:M14 family zinc carboxypeptidase [Ningiella sp. W23]|uniref:M14 family zinc carboxypeptidase n=1 Tax=Ningiella sp. W23 TaxID=3023715 RepID=UPI003756D8D6